MKEKRFLILCSSLFLQMISAKYNFAIDVVFNEISRSISFLVLSLICASLVSWDAHRDKCIAAAVVGFAAADLFFTIFYPLEPSFVRAYVFLCVFLIYWRRSYSVISSEINCEGLYCLRKRPNSLQDIVISLAGIFGPYGGYAICWKNEVYMFHHGVLRKYSLSSFDMEKYHVEYIGKDGGDVLEFSVGKRWHLFGANCLTFLRSIVNNAKKVNRGC